MRSRAVPPDVIIGHNHHQTTQLQQIRIHRHSPQCAHHSAEVVTIVRHVRIHDSVAQFLSCHQFLRIHLWFWFQYWSSTDSSELEELLEVACSSRAVTKVSSFGFGRRPTDWGSILALTPWAQSRDLGNDSMASAAAEESVPCCIGVNIPLLGSSGLTASGHLKGTVSASLCLAISASLGECLGSGCGTKWSLPAVPRSSVEQLGFAG